MLRLMLVCLLVLGSVAYASDTEDEAEPKGGEREWGNSGQPRVEAEANAAFVFASIKEWKAGLKNGTAELKITRHETRSEFGERSVKTRGKLRFEDGGRNFRYESYPAENVPGESYLATPEMQVVYNHAGKIARIHRLTTPIKHRGLANQPIDPFSACLRSRSDVDNRLRSLNDTISLYEKPANVIEGVVDDDGLYRLSVWLGDDKKRRRTFWIDPKQQYAVVRSQFDSISEKSRAKILGEYIGSFRWEIVNEIYVPVDLLFVHDQGDGNEKITKIEILWTSLNAPEGPSGFDIDSLGMVGNALLIDDRLGKEVKSRLR